MKLFDSTAKRETTEKLFFYSRAMPTPNNILIEFSLLVSNFDKQSSIAVLTR